MELKVSYHPSSAQIMGTSVSSLGWLRVDGVGEGKMERGKRAKTVEKERGERAKGQKQ